MQIKRYEPTLYNESLTLTSVTCCLPSCPFYSRPHSASDVSSFRRQLARTPSNASAVRDPSFSLHATRTTNTASDVRYAK